MVPFVVLGFVMKPLQLKGLIFLPLMIFSILLFSYAYLPPFHFVKLGFAPPETQKALPSEETVASDVRGMYLIHAA